MRISVQYFLYGTLVCNIFCITHLGVQYEIHPLTVPFDLRCQSGICNSCNMGTRDLPDMYALGHTYQANHENTCYK